MALPFCLLFQAYFVHSSAGTPESKDEETRQPKKPDALLYQKSRRLADVFLPQTVAL
jgi:hypothetical protein